MNERNILNINLDETVNRERARIAIAKHPWLRNRQDPLAFQRALDAIDKLPEADVEYLADCLKRYCEFD